MFDITKEVPDLELCKKLKECGYPQEGGGWYWVKWNESEPYVLGITFDRRNFYKQDGWVTTFPQNSKFLVKAPTIRELGEWLPGHIKRLGDLIVEKRYDGSWIVKYEEYDDMYEEKYNSMEEIDETEANARAKMLIWLVENGYLNFKESGNKNDRS